MESVSPQSEQLHSRQSSLSSNSSSSLFIKTKKWIYLFIPIILVMFGLGFCFYFHRNSQKINSAPGRDIQVEVIDDVIFYDDYGTITFPLSGPPKKIDYWNRESGFSACFLYRECSELYDFFEKIIEGLENSSVFRTQFIPLKNYWKESENESKNMQTYNFNLNKDHDIFHLLKIHAPEAYPKLCKFRSFIDLYGPPTIIQTFVNSFIPRIVWYLKEKEEFYRICFQETFSLNLVPPNKLQQLIQNFSDEHSNLKLAIPIRDIYKYYNLSLALCQREGFIWKKVYLQIPFLKKLTQFQVFKIKAIPFTDEVGNQCQVRIGNNNNRTVIFDGTTKKVSFFKDKSESCLNKKLCKLEQTSFNPEIEAVDVCLVEIVDKIISFNKSFPLQFCSVICKHPNGNEEIVESVVKIEVLSGAKAEWLHPFAF